MGGVFVLLIYFAYYLWYVFLPLGALSFFLGRRWRLRASSWWGKSAGMFFLILSLLFSALGLWGGYVNLTG